MMKMTTKPLGDSDGEIAIAWRVGTNRKGVVVVRDVECNDAMVAAELIAIRHLIFVKQVFNRDFVSGVGLCLEVYAPLIKKITKGKSTKRHLHSYSSFLKSNLQGVTIRITDEEDQFLPKELSENAIEYICENEDEGFDTVETPAMGTIRIKSHAIDQYSERLHSGEANNPVASLIGRLKHSGIKKQTLPDKTIKHKLKKYGTVENLEIWGHDTSQMHYVVVRDPNTGVGTLVTVYKRHPAYTD